MDTNRELEAILDLIPKHLIVRVREGGGPENIIASLAGSVQKLVRETEKLSPKALKTDKVVIETDDWKLGAYMEWRAKHHEEKYKECGGTGTAYTGFRDLDDGPSYCDKCHGRGRIDKGPNTPRPEIPETFREHMRRAWWDFVNDQNRLPPITEVEITEKMCETGNRALYGERWLHMPEMQKATANRWMRDALTAVLTPKSV